MKYKLTLQIIGIILFWIGFGVFMLGEWGKTPRKASDYPGVASNAQIKPIEVYQGIWHKDYLEVIKK